MSSHSDSSSDEENSIQQDENPCQICLDTGAIKVDTTLFNCNCTFYSHIRCFIKFINSQQRYKTYLDCPICHSKIDLTETPRVLAIVATVFTNQANYEVQQRIRGMNILMFSMGVYLLFWVFILSKQAFGF